MKKLFFFLAVTGLLYGEDYSNKNYFVEAGEHFNIDPLLLWTIAGKESNFNPYAINKNSNGTYDIGLMQINTIHLPTLKKFGYSREDLFDPRINTFLGGWVLVNCFKKYGVTVQGVTCYNGRIKGNLYGLNVVKKYKRLARGN